MKRRAILFVTVVAIAIIGCASPPPQRTETLNQWLEFTVAPSRITRTGETIMRSTPRADGARLVVYFDPALSPDFYFYMAMLRRDFGWTRTVDGNWRGGFRFVREGIMYVNPSRRVAIYIHPNYRTFSVFRTRIERD